VALYATARPADGLAPVTVFNSKFINGLASCVFVRLNALAVLAGDFNHRRGMAGEQLQIFLLLLLVQCARTRSVRLSRATKSGKESFAWTIPMRSIHSMP
jgi:hypothetical protein